jgi:antitoxin ParD1/3/4
MSTVEKISIALPPEMVAVVRAAVESGEYSSASEVIREALRGWKLKRKVEALKLDELRRLIKEGVSDYFNEPPSPLGERLSTHPALRVTVHKQGG